MFSIKLKYQKIKSLMHLDKQVAKSQARLFFLNKNHVNSDLITCQSSSVIVSLTTYGPRINEVFLTIESIGFQSKKPRRVILWLDEDEFNIDTLPNTLKKQQDRGLEILFCKNYKSYKKLIPTLKIDSYSSIITIDDDILYPYYFIDELIMESKKYPKTIIGYRCHKIKLSNGKPLPYKKWEYETKDTIPSELILPTGVGGIYYPRECFNDEWVNDEKFMKLSPTADDLWFKVMSIRSGLKSKKVDREINFDMEFLDLDTYQDMGLVKLNCSRKDLNSTQFSNLINHYKISF